MRLEWCLGGPELLGRGLPDPGEHRGQLLDDLLVSEADHANPEMGECFRASGIPLGLGFVIMHTTIHLDGEPDGWAVEVQDYAPDRVLPSKSQAREAFGAQRLPEHTFRIT